jgi:hypothetical protein
MDNERELDREWVEIVLVLEDCTLIDSAYDLHVFDGRRPLGAGFYLAVHHGGQRNFGKAELVGPYEHRGMVEMLYDTARHLGAAGEPGMAPRRPAPVSVLPAIRQLSDRVLTPA